jgi:hypothetical protein
MKLLVMPFSPASTVQELASCGFLNKREESPQLSRCAYISLFCYSVHHLQHKTPWTVCTRGADKSLAL